jgi:hypothetical protein
MRVGKDKEGWVQNLVLAATIVHEERYYVPQQKDKFRKLLPVQQYEDFWAKNAEAKAASRDIVAGAEVKVMSARAAKIKKMFGNNGNGRVQKNRPSTKKSPRETKEGFGHVGGARAEGPSLAREDYVGDKR